MSEKITKMTIITHKSPDLDSCVAIWILKRFIYPRSKFDYLFVDAGESLANIPNSIHVDTGGLDYDHHHTTDFVSAASLVYDRNNLHDPALRRIIKYTLRVDHGKIKANNYHFFHLVHALNGLIGKDSITTLNAMLTILDGIYNHLISRLEANRKFKTGIKFNSVLGQGIAFNTENPNIREKTYYQSDKIFLFKDDVTGFAGFKAHGNSKINFTGLYNEIIKIEPSADWFLHSSNQLLLCGSSKAPQKKLTKLDLNELINIISTYAKK
jgi:hypothetical protein